MCIHLATLLAFEFPDEPSDRQAGKRTLLVRIGSYYGVLVHNIGLFAGVLLIVAGTCTVLPNQTAFIAMATAPVAVGQMVAVSVVAEARRVRFEIVTFLAIVTISLSETLLSIVFGPLESYIAVLMSMAYRHGARASAKSRIDPL